VSKLVPFLFQILRKTSKRTIRNNINNHHYIKRSILKSRFYKELIFPIKNAQGEQVDKQWLQICVGKKCVFIKMMRLGMPLFQ